MYVTMIIAYSITSRTVSDNHRYVHLGLGTRLECDSLPRASKIKAARSELNKTVELFSIPGFEGSYRHVETAIREEIARLVSIYSIKISHDVIHVYILLMYRLHVRRFMLC